MKIDDHTAHVSLGRDEVDVGDHVVFYQNTCASRTGERGLAILGGRSSETVACRKERRGGGVVTRVWGDDYAEVRVAPGVEFDERTIVEKH